MLDELLPYYERELSHLRHLGREFAEQFPKIAARLHLEGETTADPHVERLMEGFAFMAARIHRKLDDELPEITDAFLELLYPHYLRPLPSMSIAQFQIDLDESQLTERHTIARHTQLLARAVNGVSCRFRTCYPVDVWPVKVVEARVEPVERSAFASKIENTVSLIRIRLECAGDVDFSQLNIDKLRFYIDGDDAIAHTLYELVFNSANRILLSDGDGKTVTLGRDSLAPVGFQEEEGMLEYEKRSFLAYRLLHEYFVFPQKFLFFDILNLGAAAKAGFGKVMEIVISLSEFERPDRLHRLMQAVSSSTFQLGCTPIVNLFKQHADPIRISHEKTEYEVVPDSRRRKSLEIYSIDSVRKVTRSQTEEEVVQFESFFALKHGLADSRNKRFWYASRRESALKDDAGTDIHLSLVDSEFNPAVPAFEALSVELTCTNRDLPSLLPFGGPQGDLQLEGSSLIKRVRCLRKPTPTLRPPLRHSARWRLISHLALNHLSIVEGGREILLEMLSLYNFTESGAVKKQISGITSVQSEPCVVRVNTLQRSAFVRGTRVSMEFDESEYAGSGVYLFASVLERFLGLYCTVNSFTELQVKTKQREKVLAKWPARLGDAILV